MPQSKSGLLIFRFVIDRAGRVGVSELEHDRRDHTFALTLTASAGKVTIPHRPNMNRFPLVARNRRALCDRSQQSVGRGRQLLGIVGQLGELGRDELTGWPRSAPPRASGCGSSSPARSAHRTAASCSGRCTLVRSRKKRRSYSSMSRPARPTSGASSLPRIDRPSAARVVADGTVGHARPQPGGPLRGPSSLIDAGEMVAQGSAREVVSESVIRTHYGSAVRVPREDGSVCVLPRGGGAEWAH